MALAMAMPAKRAEICDVEPPLGRNRSGNHMVHLLSSETAVRAFRIGLEPALTQDPPAVAEIRLVRHRLALPVRIELGR